MSNLFSINSQVAVITGGTGVLGRAIAKHLAAEGATVVILGRNAEVGDKLVAEIKAVGGVAEFMVTDVMSTEVMTKNRDEIMAKYGRVDTLINAAGGNMPGATIAPTGTIFDLKTDDFQQVVNLNLMGTVIPTQIFLEPMVAQKSGSIINFSSMSSYRPMTRVAGYSSAKAAINNFTAYMATEIASKFGEGIRINAIAPGFFLTEQNRTLLTNEDGSYTARGEAVIRQTPYGRFGRPEELCGTIQYLMSDAASFVTGTVAIVDGGFNTFAM